MKKLLLALFLLGLTACGSNPTEKSTAPAAAPAAVVESSPTAAFPVLPKRFPNKQVHSEGERPTAQVEGKIKKLFTSTSSVDGSTLYMVILYDGTVFEYWDKDSWHDLLNSENKDTESCFKVWDATQTNREVAVRIHVGKCNPSKPKQAVRPFEGK
jgi:hypothetical protein